MSKNFKPLHEQIANKLIAELKEGTSAFQKPWNDSDAPAFTIPVNPTTNKNYRGMNAPNCQKCAMNICDACWKSCNRSLAIAPARQAV